jgi:hypothetical protein
MAKGPNRMAAAPEAGLPECLGQSHWVSGTNVGEHTKAVSMGSTRAVGIRRELHRARALPVVLAATVLAWPALAPRVRAPRVRAPRVGALGGNLTATETSGVVGGSREGGLERRQARQLVVPGTHSNTFDPSPHR